MAVLITGFLAARPVAAQGARVERLGAPRWWVERPADSANFQTPPIEGPLEFAVRYRNPNRFAVLVAVSFQSYAADGTRGDGCYQLGGGGPGATEFIAPGGTAWLHCQGGYVPLETEGLQVTSRLWSVVHVQEVPAPVTVLEAILTPAEPSRFSTNFGATTSLEARGKRDVPMVVRFRFVAADSAQVATCIVRGQVEPEVALRLNCPVPISLPNHLPAPTAVQVDVLVP